MGLLWLVLSCLLLFVLLALFIPMWRWQAIMAHRDQQPLWRNKIINILIMLFLSVLTIVLYLNYGGSTQLAAWYRAQANAAETARLLQSLQSPAQVIATLRTKLQQQPDSAKGWYLLGRLYMTQHDYNAAVAAFARAHALLADDNDITMQYVLALYFADQQQLLPRTKQLIQQVLARDAQHEIAINLLAMDAYQQQHYQQAIHYWEQLLPRHAPQSADGQALLDAIARAQKALQNQH